jgi:hypothetical protein
MNTQNPSNALSMSVQTKTHLSSLKPNETAQHKMNIIVNTFKSMNDEIAVSATDDNLLLQTQLVSPKQAVDQIKEGLATAHSITGYNSLAENPEKETVITLVANPDVLRTAKENLLNMDIACADSMVDNQPVLRITTDNPPVKFSEKIMGILPN